eukprot:875747-Rhodomonas_salina.1
MTQTHALRPLCTASALLPIRFRRVCNVQYCHSVCPCPRSAMHGTDIVYAAGQACSTSQGR